MVQRPRLDACMRAWMDGAVAFGALLSIACMRSASTMHIHTELVQLSATVRPCIQVWEPPCSLRPFYIAPERASCMPSVIPSRTSLPVWDPVLKSLLSKQVIAALPPGCKGQGGNGWGDWRENRKATRWPCPRQSGPYCPLPRCTSCIAWERDGHAHVRARHGTRDLTSYHAREACMAAESVTRMVNDESSCSVAGAT